MNDPHQPNTIDLISLLGETDNLLSNNAWEPIEPQVPCRQDGERLICQAAPPGVAEIDKPDDKVSAGLQQRVRLDQAAPCVIVAGVETRSEGLSAKRLFDYALALTLLDEDDNVIASPLTPFSLPSGDWQRAQVRIVPPRPVKEAIVRLCCLCQEGEAEFRNASLVQLPADQDLVSIDGTVISAGAALAEGWWLLDVAEPTQLAAAEAAEALGLTVATGSEPRGDGLHAQATVTDTTGRDRALKVLYVHPPRLPDGQVEDGRWRWLANMRQEVQTVSPGEYVFAANVQAGQGQLSRWPLAAVAAGAGGRAISLDLTAPAVYRVGYSAGLGVLYIAFDIALTLAKPTAALAADVFGFDGTWGFRGAIDRMYQLQPDAFADRTGTHGLWVPFFQANSIEGWEDFGFRFKEGIGSDLAWGNETGKLLTFHYVEPLTFWVPMDPDVPRDMDHAMAKIDQLKAEGNHEAHSFASSVYHRPSGRYAGIAVDAAWCDGIVWSMNSAPHLPEPNHFSTIINDEKIANWVENPDPLQNVSGWYIDSIEGYITEELDYRRDHFAAMSTPLSFDGQTLQPVVFTGLVVYEFTRRLAEELRSRGGLTMANTVPGRYCWLVPYLDVLGTETNWHHDGKWTPLSDEEMLYRRALSGAKPYCFLMNSNFAEFTYDMSERYMRRCVAYGMYPGYFSANAFDAQYFGNPDMYNRDRGLFKKYVPLCKRVGEAGWQPITNARSSDRKVYVERFGRCEQYLTVFNDAGQKRNVTITLDGDWPDECTELLTNEPMTVDAGKITLTMDSEDVAVLAFE